MTDSSLLALTPNIGDVRPFDPLLEMLKGINVKAFTAEELEDLRWRLIMGLQEEKKDDNSR